jgi:hypothetical protein
MNRLDASRPDRQPVQLTISSESVRTIGSSASERAFYPIRL